jgi:hypothetical protein
MRSSLALWVCALLVVALGAFAGDGGPVFLQWLMPESPNDQTIREYWEKAEAEEASPEELLDLGTMLFLRGYPKDAVRTYQRALKLDRKLHEAWFRIGLVKHREGEIRAAEDAYRKCLYLLSGHGWCNFYMALLQERSGRPSQALDYYRRAFKVAPELANPKVNPEILYSELQLAAVLKKNDHDRFTGYLPMSFIEPEKVEQSRAKYEPEPTPTPVLIPIDRPIPVSARPPTMVVIDDSTIDSGGGMNQLESVETEEVTDATSTGRRSDRGRRTMGTRQRRPRTPGSVQPSPTPEPEIE